jgi:hypothetical protein
LRHVLIAIDNALPVEPINAAKKAKLVALVYQSASETGQVDPLLVRKAIDLAS